MTAPFFTEQEARTRTTFMGLMWALSAPGQPQSLIDVQSTPYHPYLLIAEALLDLETSYYTDVPQLAPLLDRTTARAESADRAEYLFLPNVTDLTPIRQASIGDMLFPDRAATLILGCQFGTGTRLGLSGPGIRGQISISVGGLPAEFWALRLQMRHYPLVWDILLVSTENQVIGLPRSTALEIRE